MDIERRLEGLLIPEVELLLPDSIVTAYGLQTDEDIHKIKARPSDWQFDSEGKIKYLTVEEHNEKLSDGRFVPSLPTVCNTIYTLLCQERTDEAKRLLTTTMMTSTYVDTRIGKIVHNDPIVGKLELSAEFPLDMQYVTDGYAFQALTGIQDTKDFSERLKQIGFPLYYWGPGFRQVWCGTNGSTPGDGSRFGLYTCTEDTGPQDHAGPVLPFKYERVERKAVKPQFA